MEDHHSKAPPFGCSCFFFRAGDGRGHVQLRHRLPRAHQDLGREDGLLRGDVLPQPLVGLLALTGFGDKKYLGRIIIRFIDSRSQSDHKQKVSLWDEQARRTLLYVCSCIWVEQAVQCEEDYKTHTGKCVNLGSSCSVTRVLGNELFNTST